MRSSKSAGPMDFPLLSGEVHAKGRSCKFSERGFVSLVISLVVQNGLEHDRLADIKVSLGCKFCVLMSYILVSIFPIIPASW